MRKWLIPLMMAILLISLGARSRYSGVWKKASGGIAYRKGNVNISNGTLTIGGAEIYLMTKTVIKTINLDSSDDNDDFEFDDTAANSTSQNVNLGAIIPAYAEVVSVHARCFETVGGSQTFQITLGTSSAGNQLLAQTTIDAANEIDGTATGNAPKLEASNAARNVWINGDPSGNWSACAGAGRWSVMITYIDYGAVHTAGIP